MKLDFVFVCQSGPLEAAAALLAASLTKFGPADFRLHVIEPLPSHEYGTVTNLSRRYFAALGAKWYQRKNPISHDYKIGN